MTWLPKLVLGKFGFGKIWLWENLCACTNTIKVNKLLFNGLIYMIAVHDNKFINHTDSYISPSYAYI